MTNRKSDEGRQFALDFYNDIKYGRILKDCMMNHSDDFTRGMEKLHRNRFITYLGSCGCFLMDKRLAVSKEEYCG